MRRPLSDSLDALVVLLVFAVAQACGGGGGGGSSPTQPPPTPSPNPSQIVVDVQDNSYSPKSITVEPGDTVVWRMTGSAAGHTVTDEGGAFDSGFVFTGQGATFQHTFTEADRGRTFQYRCTSHYACCQMQGSVRVGESAPAPSPGY